jgi:hypothetical protein
MSRSAELYYLFDCDLKMSQLACMHRPRYSAIQEYIREHPCSKSSSLRAVCGAREISRADLVEEMTLLIVHRPVT